MKLSFLLLASVTLAGKRKNKKKQVKTQCTDCPEFATCEQDSNDQCITQCSQFFEIDSGSETCVPTQTEEGAAEGVILNAKIAHNMQLIVEKLFNFTMIKNPKRQKDVVNKMKTDINGIHEFIKDRIGDYQASTLDGATNDPMNQCYYEKSPVFDYSHTAFDQWKINYQSVLDSIDGIQRNHDDAGSEIEHPDMYHAAEALIDVYKEMVVDMVDYCKTDAANECEAENNQTCVLQPLVTDEEKEKGFKCECMDGFEENEEGKCVDINECERGPHNCDRADGLTCQNLIGHQSHVEPGYTCLCENGYYEVERSLFMRSIDDQTKCIDIENKDIEHLCDAEPKPCPLNADCNPSDEEPYYECSCMNGFAFFPVDSEAAIEDSDNIPTEDEANFTPVTDTDISPLKCEQAQTFLVKMDFTEASNRKRRQVNAADNIAAMDRVRDALVVLGIPQNDIVTKLFMQGEWREKRSCDIDKWRKVTQTEWDNLPAEKQISSFLFFTVAVKQSALDALALMPPNGPGIDINNCAGNNPQGAPCAAVGSAMAAAALGTHNSCRSLQHSFTIWRVGDTQLENWRQFIPNFIVNPLFAPYGRKRRGVDTDMVAPYGRKRIARRQKKSKKKKQKNSGGVITPTEQEYHSCELKAFVEYQIRLFKEYLLEKYNQFATEEMNLTDETTFIGLGK